MRRMGSAAATAAARGMAKGRVRADRAVRARAFGLELPDRFDEERREALVCRVSALNDAAAGEFWERFLALASRGRAA